MTKVLHVSYSDTYGGAGRAAYNIHLAVTEVGIDSTMFVCHKGTSDSAVIRLNGLFHQVAHVARASVSRLVRIALAPRRAVSLQFLPSIGLLRRINKSDADVVHLHWCQAEMLSILSISWINKPIVWTLHDSWVVCGISHVPDSNACTSPTIRGLLYQLVDKVAIWWKLLCWRRSIELVAPSLWMKKVALGSRVAKRWQVEIIPNPIDISFWVPLDKASSRRTLGLPLDSIVIGFGSALANHDPNKGFEILHEALGSLNPKLFERPLVGAVFGVANKELYSDAGIPLHQFPYLERYDLRLLYSAVDLLVSPSLTESFGQIVGEAMACGTPVVSFKSGGPEDLIDHLENGFICSDRTKSSLVKGIYWGISIRNYKKYGDAARAKIQSKCEPKIVGEKYAVIYRKAVTSFN